MGKAKVHFLYTGDGAAAMIYPAPWNLTGKGWVLVYRLPQSFGDWNIQLPPVFSDAFTSRYGLIIFADYDSSDAGPYQELLCIPGTVRSGKKRCYTISSIYVSTWDSVESGRANWGIPKELAEFNYTALDASRDQLKVWKDGLEIASCTLKKGNIPFPVTTKIVRLRLLQWYQDLYYATRVSGFGWGRRAVVESFTSDGRYFPSVETGNITAAAAVRPLRMKFHQPEIKPWMKKKKG